MMDPHSYRFSTEIDEVLSPHSHVFTSLLDGTDTNALTMLQQSYIPALDYVREATLRGRGLAHTGLVAHLGDIDIKDFGRIVNWIFMKIPGAQGTLHKWLVSTPTAHAITLVLKERHKASFMEDPHYPRAGSKEEQYYFLLHKAWRYQVTHVHEDVMTRDVDLECLSLFERRLFSTVRNNVATYGQWGLDAGDHQEKWYPYRDLPQGWYDESAEFSDSEVLVRVSYIRSQWHPN